MDTSLELSACLLHIKPKLLTSCLMDRFTDYAMACNWGCSFYMETFTINYGSVLTFAGAVSHKNNPPSLCRLSQWLLMETLGLAQQPIYNIGHGPIIGIFLDSPCRTMHGLWLLYLLILHNIGLLAQQSIYNNGHGSIIGRSPCRTNLVCVTDVILQQGVAHCLAPSLPTMYII